MAKNTLTSSDILDLISDYKSEIRKLSVKMTFCENRVAELEDMLKKHSVSSLDEGKDLSMPHNRFGSRQVKSRKPYPLSEWDRIILGIISENGKAMSSKDIYEKTFIKAKEAGIFMDEVKSKAKINQCLVKLSNRRHDLVKVRYGGRGFAYKLAE